MATNLLSLEAFREIMAFSPFHFWQWANNKVPLDSGCDSLVREYAWQWKGGAGRSEIRTAIGKAEKGLRDYLGYSAAPHWVTGEFHDFYPVMSGRAGNYGPGVVTLKEGKIRRIGKAAWQLVEELDVVINDFDGDGLADTFTVTATLPTDSQLEDLGLFFLAADKPQNVLQGAANKDYQVRPVELSLNTAGDEVTFQGRAWLLLRPRLYEGLTHYPGYNHSANSRDSSGSFDPDTAANYVPKLGLYRRVISSPDRATLIYSDGCGSLTEHEVCVEVINHETGQVALNAGGNCPCGLPGWWGYWIQGMCPRGSNVRLKISYEAGADLDDWQVTVARMAAAELMRDICGCDDANYELRQWMADSADPDGNFKPALNELSSPLGNKRGHIEAWKVVRNLRLVRGTSL